MNCSALLRSVVVGSEDEAEVEASTMLDGSVGRALTNISLYNSGPWLISCSAVRRSAVGRRKVAAEVEARLK